MENPKVNERRRFTRINFDANATIEQGAWVHPVHLLDISVKGLLAQVDGQENIGNQPATLRIKLADCEHITMQVALIHRTEHYLGFQCESIDVESAAHLRRLIELNLGGPDAAERVLDELLASTSNSSYKDPRR